ncbi:MAG: 50S ribosomal protein L23 [Bacteroidetes bacterium]|jgi:large subunit ribosomal protein L23|nr:50S ribosomal protein L23 [Bacteroidota bacterium]
MKLTEILIKPILTEKANGQQEKLRRYAFKVDRRANKLEIKSAIEQFYGVNVMEVNTLVVPGKNKSRSTKAGVVSGIKSGYKKALVTVAEGETIDLYATI